MPSVVRTPDDGTIGDGFDPHTTPYRQTGCVRVWDLRVRHPVFSLEPQEGEPARDCWAVAFGACVLFCLYMLCWGGVCMYVWMDGWMDGADPQKLHDTHAC
jgi:hypothetical protein